MSASFLFQSATPAPAPLAAFQHAPQPRGSASSAALGAHERGIMNGLAAFQLRYGKTEEALAILQLSNRIWPEDRQTLRLLTQAFIQMKDWESADMTEAAHRRLSGPVRPGRMDHLRQAIIHFGCLRIAEARSAFQDFVRIGRQGAL